MVSRIYNRVAASYDRDWSGIYASARDHCMAQIATQLEPPQRRLDTVDFGIGTGNSIHDLGKLVPLGSCTGFDLSAGMLNQAARKLGPGVRLIEGDAIDAPAYLEPKSIDLALCHFLLSFVDADELLQVAFGLLRPGGLLSLATSTQRSLQQLHSGRFRRTGQLFGVRRALSKVTTPADHRQCLEMLQRHGFEIVSDHLHRQEVSFESFGDIREWALNSGWVAGSLNQHTALRIAGCTTVFALARVFMHPLYPIDAVNEISIVLARKPVVEDARAPAFVLHGDRSPAPDPGNGARVQG